MKDKWFCVKFEVFVVAEDIRKNWTWENTAKTLLEKLKDV